MAEHSTHIRHVLLHEFESGHPAAEAHRNLRRVFGTEAPSERSVRAWFQRFKDGNKKLEDETKNLAEQEIHIKYAVFCCQSWLFAVHREQWTAISRNGGKARSAAPTYIERQQPNRQRRLDI
ncbi:hypothetical protein RB195_024369 [Necator americanus]|uniref:Mos1 transposase HTH domain-containing protein n=1 Tax=Necator americanus TaxID=51031 RepID=A0ABR1EMW1_NECAM